MAAGYEVFTCAFGVQYPHYSDHAKRLHQEDRVNVVTAGLCEQQVHGNGITHLYRNGKKVAKNFKLITDKTFFKVAASIECPNGRTALYFGWGMFSLLGPPGFAAEPGGDPENPLIWKKFGKPKFVKCPIVEIPFREQ